MSVSSDASALTAKGTAEYQTRVEEAAAEVRESSAETPAIGLLSEANLGTIVQGDSAEAVIPYADLPHFPAPEGTVRLGTLSGSRVLAMEQSLHLYDGDAPRDVVFPVRMMARAGVDTLLLTATARAVNPQFEPGDMMLVTDHINFQGQNPLVGPNVDAWGPRFPDMTEPYDPELRQTVGEVAQSRGVSLSKGVLLGLLGPGPETTAEHRMARRLGADAVGTSVIPEVIAARHMDMTVLAVVLLADGDGEDGFQSAAASDGQKDQEQSGSRLERLLAGVVSRLGPTP